MEAICLHCQNVIMVTRQGPVQIGGAAEEQELTIFARACFAHMGQFHTTFSHADGGSPDARGPGGEIMQAAGLIMEYLALLHFAGADPRLPAHRHRLRERLHRLIDPPEPPIV